MDYTYRELYEITPDYWEFQDEFEALNKMKDSTDQALVLARKFKEAYEEVEKNKKLLDKMNQENLQKINSLINNKTPWNT